MQFEWLIIIILEVSDEEVMCFIRSANIIN